ncbi:hypothetical protein [Oceanirhabdus sp. W0125-5]|uniref:hypothetical protein n=1 Tax=Oceanirhabdus sp. W0125-5 TaxID=2999116 RepID=UPI0022F2F065|nr:hypothetical protein [Oceanirhabdus sp. W0125-5]WBW96964.1 hypothetical protein OW730_25230 [Oceanirhabdus sp. W0125-5]
MEKFNHDDDIKIPDEFDNRINMSLKRAESGSYYYRNKIKITTSLVLVFVLFLGMNPNVRAYTSELPIVKGVMEWFKSDKKIQQLKANNFKIYDLATEKDGYRLYMKDIYIDEEEFSMKIAVEDEKGNVFDIQEGDISGNYLASRFGSVNGENIKNIDPWYDVRGFCDLSNAFNKNNFYYGKIDLKLKATVSDGNKIIEFDEVNIKDEDISYVKSKKIQFNKEYVFDGVKVLVENLKIFPNRMEVRVSSIDSDIDSKVMFTKVKLLDKNGKIYEGKGKALYWDGNYREFFNFDDSIYFQKDNSIEKIEIDLGYGKVESMKIVPREKMDYGKIEEFNYDNKSFKAYREKDKELNESIISYYNGFYKLGISEQDVEFTYLKIKDDDVNENESKYYIKKWTGIWERMYNNIDEEIKTVRITKNEIERQLGMQLEEILKLNDDEFNDYAIKFNKYLNSRLERKDGKINFDEIKETMKRYIDYGQIILGKSSGMKEPLTFRKETVKTKKEWEFGILDLLKIKTEHIVIELD